MNIISNNASSRSSRALRVGGVTLAVLLALSGCAGAGTAGAAPSPISSSSSADGIVVTDAWAKATEKGMTGVFGKIENRGSADVTLVSAETSVSPMVEMHETVADETGQKTMREKEGGFVIKPGDNLELAPGADHIMLMDLSAPLKAGDDLTVTLTFSDGSTTKVIVPIKEYAGANENYSGGEHGGSE